jgi:hypothetical protein
VCGLCGMLGGAEHWADGVIRDAPGVWVRRQARLRYAGLAQAMLASYGVKVADWHGTSFIITGPTGRSEIARDLDDLWTKAEGVLGRPVDPLDPVLVDAIEASAGNAGDAHDG